MMYKGIKKIGKYMSIRKFLHINIIAMIFFAGQLCYGGELATHGEYQPTRWERFTQHPIASHIPTALVGGYGLYKSFSSDASSSWLSSFALTAAPLWATYVQSKQRASERQLQENENALHETKPRTSQLRCVLPLGIPVLATLLNAYYHDNWLPGLWWGAKMSAIPALYVVGSIWREDLAHADEIMDWAKNADSKQGDINIDSIGWALDVLNNPIVHTVWQENMEQGKNDLTVLQADNLLKIAGQLSKKNGASATKNIQFLKNLVITDMPEDLCKKLVDDVREVTELLLNAGAHRQFDLTRFSNNTYQVIENVLMRAAKAKENEQKELSWLFARYFEAMEQVLVEYKKRTELYKEVGIDVAEREKVEQFLQKMINDRYAISDTVERIVNSSYEDNKHLLCGDYVIDRNCTILSKNSKTYIDQIEQEINEKGIQVDWTFIGEKLNRLKDKYSKTSGEGRWIGFLSGDVTMKGMSW